MAAPTPTYLYKILPTPPPSPLPSRLPLSDLDRSDGYIHLSTATQVPGTADKWFNDYEELWLLKIRYEDLVKGTDGTGEVKAGAEIKWEEVEVEGGKTVFPHFYRGDLGVGNVVEGVKVVKGEGWIRLELEW